MKRKNEQKKPAETLFRKVLSFLKKGLLLLILIAVGSIAFLLLRPEGQFTPADPSAKVSANSFRILSWNVLMDREKSYLGKPWAERKKAFMAALEGEDFDLVCLQEAVPSQVAFFAETFHAHNFYGIGRDDGKGSGEHCPIYYKRSRFTEHDRGTFWLSPTPEKPSNGWGEISPRICSWLELEDQKSGKRFRVYNIHLQLHPFAQKPALELVVERLKETDLPVIVVGDMNCPPGYPAIQVMKENGLRDAESSGALTFQLFGQAIRSLDHIFIDDFWRVPEGGIIREKHAGVHPSDHFGLWATCVPVE